MFTGLIEQIGTVAQVKRSQGEDESFDFVVQTTKDFLQGSIVGDSIAVNGVCLTATQIDLEQGTFEVNVANETLNLTNLGDLKEGSQVNLELAATMNKRLGGHVVQGHVDTTAKLLATVPDGDSIRQYYEMPSKIHQFLIPKGYIAIDGTSLTLTTLEAPSFLSEVPEGSRVFGIMLIRHTQEHSIVGFKQAGDTVNIECDPMGKGIRYMLERMVAEQSDLSQLLTR